MSITSFNLKHEKLKNVLQRENTQFRNYIKHIEMLDQCYQCLNINITYRKMYTVQLKIKTTGFTLVDM